MPAKIDEQVTLNLMVFLVSNNSVGFQKVLWKGTAFKVCGKTIPAESHAMLT
jgi:hypothetical protein